MTWRFTSPALSESERILNECPVGAAIREAPHSYDVMRAASLAENDGVAFLQEPRLLQELVGVVQSERARLRDLEDLDRRAASDARYAARALKGR